MRLHGHILVDPVSILPQSIQQNAPLMPKLVVRRILFSLTALAMLAPALPVSGQLPVSPAQAQQLLRDNQIGRAHV